MPDSLLLLVLIFIVSLAVLVFAADKFIASSEKIGLALGIPSFVIGVTIVALGTSLPELVSSIFAIINNTSEIVIGNVVGSNITNILLILGVVGVVARSFTIGFNFKKIDLPFLIAATAFMIFAAYDRKVELWEGLVSVFILLAYIIISLRSGKDLKDAESPKFKPLFLFWLVLGGIGIYFGAKYNVESIIKIGEKLNIGAEIIALTAVALGTSLPELFVSLAAIRKGNAEIAVGNVLGSNIFNAAGILGVSRLVGDLSIPANVVKTSIPIMAVATLFFILIVWDRKVRRWEGIVLLLGYAAFMWFTFV